MKKTVTAKTKQAYYVANIGGLIILVGVIAWCFYLSFDNGSIDFTSVPLWIALLLVFMVPFAVISIFSAMKDVVVTESGLTISYVFQSHKSQVNFSEIVEFKPGGSPGKFGESFSVSLADGRSFEFTRSQFDNFEKLMSIVRKTVVEKKK